MIELKSELLSKKNFADAVLLLVSLTWGIAFPLMHIAIQNVGPYRFLLAKYLFSTLIFVPFFLYYARQKRLITLMPFGFLLGLLYFFACLFQAQGLDRISAGRNAFITSLVVVIVPFLSPIFHRIYPKKVDVISIVFVLLGMYLLLDPFKNGTIQEGDILSFIGTIFFAVHLQTLQKIQKKFNEPIVFDFYQVLFISLFAFICCMGDLKSLLIFTHLSFSIWSILFSLGAIVMLAFFIQTKFQPMTTPSRAVLIYNLQPALAAFFSYFILDERMSGRAMIGAAIAITAVVSAQLYRLYKENQQKKIEEMALKHGGYPLSRLQEKS